MLYCNASRIIAFGEIEMSFRSSALLWLLVAVFTCACSNQPNTTNSDTKSTPTSAAPPDPFAETRGIFAKECQNCHGTDGKGGRVKLEDGKTLRVPSLREGHALRHPDSDFRKQIMNGGDGMPAFKDKFSPQQIDELIRFVRQEFQPGHTPPAEKSKM